MLFSAEVARQSAAFLETGYFAETTRLKQV